MRPQPDKTKEVLEIAGKLLTECKAVLIDGGVSATNAARLHTAIYQTELRINALSHSPGEKAGTVKLLICNYISDGNYTRAEMISALESVFKESDQIPLMVNSYLTDLLSAARAHKITDDTDFRGKVAKVEPIHGHIVWR